MKTEILYIDFPFQSVRKYRHKISLYCVIWRRKNPSQGPVRIYRLKRKIKFIFIWRALGDCGPGVTPIYSSVSLLRCKKLYKLGAVQFSPVTTRITSPISPQNAKYHTAEVSSFNDRTTYASLVLFSLLFLRVFAKVSNIKLGTTSTCRIRHAPGRSKVIREFACRDIIDRSVFWRHALLHVPI